MPSGCQLGSIFSFKIQQNPIKIKSQGAFKKILILASIFYRFGLRFGSQVGTMLPTKTPQDAPKTPYETFKKPPRHQDALKDPKTPPRPPKIPPRPPKTAPRNAQEPPEVLINWRGGTKAQPSTIRRPTGTACWMGTRGLLILLPDSSSQRFPS